MFQHQSCSVAEEQGSVDTHITIHYSTLFEYLRLIVVVDPKFGEENLVLIR
jgi:hypothetical protein